MNTSTSSPQPALLLRSVSIQCTHIVWGGSIITKPMLIAYHTGQSWLPLYLKAIIKFGKFSRSRMYQTKFHRNRWAKLCHKYVIWWLEIEENGCHHKMYFVDFFHAVYPSHWSTANYLEVHKYWIILTDFKIQKIIALEITVWQSSNLTVLCNILSIHPWKMQSYFISLLILYGFGTTTVSV